MSVVIHQDQTSDVFFVCFTGITSIRGGLHKLIVASFARATILRNSPIYPVGKGIVFAVRCLVVEHKGKVIAASASGFVINEPWNHADIVTHVIRGRGEIPQLEGNLYERHCSKSRKGLATSLRKSNLVGIPRHKRKALPVPEPTVHGSFVVGYGVWAGSNKKPATGILHAVCQPKHRPSTLQHVAVPVSRVSTMTDRRRSYIKSYGCGYCAATV